MINKTLVLSEGQKMIIIELCRNAIRQNRLSSGQKKDLQEIMEEIFVSDVVDSQ